MHLHPGERMLISDFLLTPITPATRGLGIRERVFNLPQYVTDYLAFEETGNDRYECLSGRVCC